MLHNLLRRMLSRVRALDALDATIGTADAVLRVTAPQTMPPHMEGLEAPRMDSSLWVGGGI